jgi:hypothetical protein
MAPVDVRVEVLRRWIPLPGKPAGKTSGQPKCPSDDEDQKERRPVNGWMPVTTRKLLLFGELIFTRQFRCVRVERRGSVSYSISRLQEPEKPLWLPLRLRPEPDSAPAWKKWASMPEAEFALWLSKVLGPERARDALHALKTSPPRR